jgi:hypothetical protein
MLQLTSMESQEHKNNFFTKTQKNFIGSTMSAVGIVFLLTSIALIITLLILIQFKVSILFGAIAQGAILPCLVIGLLTTGIVSFAVGSTLQK